MNKAKNITDETKKAWSKNWEERSIEEALKIFSYPRVQRLLDIFVSILPKKGKILEGGCGLGPWVIKLRSLGYNMVGVDYDAMSVAKVREYDKDIPVYVSDVEATSFDDNCFDAYMSLGVLEHFCRGPQKAIQEAARILKPGGIFLVVLPYLNIFSKFKLPMDWLRKNQAIRRFLGKKKKDFYYEYYFNINEISDLLRKGGFAVESVRPVDHIFTFVSFSRIFKDLKTYDGENMLAIKCADFFEKIFPWQTAGSSLIVAKCLKKREH